MQFIGLAGRAGSGKDTIADYLVETYGFVKFAFSDALYEEVRAAFGLKDESLLRNRDTKEVETYELNLSYCSDYEFRVIGRAALLRQQRPLDSSMSPRQIMQLWGTEYRRAQDTDYWIKKAAAFVQAFREVADPQTCAGLVNAGVRFQNEVEYISSQGGYLWHVHRRDLSQADHAGHASESGIKFDFRHDKEIHNNSTIEKLRTAASLLYSSDARRLWVEDDCVVTIDERSRATLIVDKTKG